MPWEWLFPVALVPAIWAGVLVLIGKVSGWSRLAEKFRAEREPLDGTRFDWQFLRIGWCDYNGCLTIRVSPEGVYLAVWPIFVGHLPLLIPWSELRLIEERRSRWFATAKFEVSSPPLVRLQLPLKAIDAAREWLRKEQTP